jgi:hypothetical protein
MPDRRRRAIAKPNEDDRLPLLHGAREYGALCAPLDAIFLASPTIPMTASDALDEPM